MTKPIPMRALDPVDIADPREQWLTRNDEVVRHGLDWLRRRLDAQITFQRSAGPPPAFGADGTAVMSDLRADWLLRQSESPRFDASHELIEGRATYDSARAAMAQEGQPCALDALARTFGLARFDVDVLLLTMAPQVDAGFAALYGYVHDRMSVCHATRHLAAILLCDGPAERALARQRLAPHAALRRHALISTDGSDALSPLTMDERMLGFIHGQNAVDGRLDCALRALAAVPLPERLSALADALVDDIAARDRPIALIAGPRRSGKRAIAARVAASFGLAPVELDVRALPALAADRRALLAILDREAALSRLCVVINAAPGGAAIDDPGFSNVSVAREVAAQLEGVVLVVSEDPVPGLNDVARLRVTPLSREERVWCWHQALADVVLEPESPELLADHFPFGPTQIVEIARSLPDTADIGAHAVWTACRERSAGRLDGLAQRIEPRRGWGDIVLPPSVLADLRAVADQVRCRPTVYGTWGYEALLPRGRGVSALFAGPSGVGKTLAAEVIAYELALDLYCTDLSAVVSKYIGETEKNLKRVFDAAEESGAVLFIDEADALFGKRSEVKDSHDRYANIEISYLLQRVEQYSGLAILATNMKSHIDFAFLRRLRYLIDIPFPGFSDRRMLWRKAFPPAAPLDDIDIERLAMLEIAGGNIIVIATNAAFLAAAEGTAIAMRHVEQAGRAEFRKLDRMFEMPRARP